ncbi:hypothetical protein E5D57_001253 [Metarhizium anisopliae]|nr:hypothetical protein E5D57_001253 [Metarhizium anisopliae]
MSPGPRPALRAPAQAFGFPEHAREREVVAQAHQRVPLPPKGGGGANQVPELRDQRPLAAAQPIPSAHPDSMLERQQREREREQRDRERELAARQAERQSMRINAEAELAHQQRHYEQQPPPYGHRHQSSIGQGPRGEPLSLSRPPSQEPSRSAAAQPYPPPTMHQQPPPPSHAVRGMMDHPSVAQSPPLGPSSRPMSSLQQRPPPGQAQEPYGHAPPPGPPAPTPSGASRPPTEPRKTSNIMSLLNDDPPPASKRVSEVSNVPSGPSGTPPPPTMGRPPPPGPAPPSQMRREPEPQYSPYGRAATNVSAMPSLKPTAYGGSPGQPPHMGAPRSTMGMPNEPVPADRDPYYRGHAGYQAGHHSGNNSPQTAHRYPPAQAQPQYPPQGGYASYGPGGQPTHAASPPPPQYGGHGSAARSREVPPSGRDNAWPQQPTSSGAWPSQPSKPSQGPPPQQQWAPPHPSSTPKPSTPAQAWASAPPPQHVGMRDDRGAPVYASSSQPPQHSMQSRYPPPGSRGPEPVPPPPAQGYPRYASTPGPGPRDPREHPRSYTPGYDSRGPPPGSGYPAPDPREMQMRDARDPRDPRDPRDVMGRGLRPHEYERHPDQYRR